jgi:hypothetical protein
VDLIQYFANSSRTAGAFKIDVLENMRPIIGSPFQCLSYDPAKVKVVGIQRERVHLVFIDRLIN